MRNIHTFSVVSVMSLLLGACASPPPTPAKSAIVKDGELALPANYKTWPKFLHTVQRPDAKQVRDIYIDPKGHTTQAGTSFPYGTVMVMENHKAKLNADGTPATDDNGKLIKDSLAAIFVMGKGEGWGAGMPEGLATGEWVYAAYKPDGSKADNDLKACRACHAPLKTKDFVHRLDEYFAKR